MMPDKIQELVNQPLGGWTIVEWYSATIPSGKTGYFKTLAGAQDCATDTRSVKKILVLTNGMSHFSLSGGKKIDRSNVCQEADRKAQEDMAVCRAALQKLTSRERVLLDFPVNITEQAFHNGIAKIKSANLGPAERQALGLCSLEEEEQERKNAKAKLSVTELATLDRILSAKFRRDRLAAMFENQGI